jgi:hypothetical protein
MAMIRRMNYRNRRGVSLVEAGVTTAALTTLMLGMVDMGVGIFRMHVISEAARQGARQASVHGTLADPTPPKSGLLGQWGPTTVGPVAANSGNTQVAGMLPYLHGVDLSTTQITFQWPDGNNNVESRVEVTVTATWTPIMTSLFGASAYTLSASSTMPIAH